nr:hypothetical protein B0A51_08219 [Rachicladosporium sp. CCFEE 5018]
MAQRALFALHLLLLLPSKALAQNCYYPNGDLSTIDYPCSSEGGACCPLNWQCLSNGLCYLENENYFERHTCTDQFWGSSCPDFCFYNGTAGGNEAILQCDDNTYCCDWNRVSGNCCNKAATSFDLAQGTQIALISTTGPRTPVTSSAGITSSSTTITAGTTSTTSTSTASQSTTQSATTASSLPTTAQTSTIVIVSTPTSSGASSITITQVRTLISTPSATTSSATAAPAAHSLAPIVGLAVGVTFFLLICALVAFLLFRRRRKAKYAKFNPQLFSPETSSAGATDMYAHLGGEDPYKDGRPELDSYPVAEPKPLNELEGPMGGYEAKQKIAAAGGMGSPQSNGKSESSVSPMAGSTDRWSTVSELQQPAGPQQPTWWTPGSGLRPGQHSSVHPFMRPELQQGQGMTMGNVPEDSAPVYRAYQPPSREVAELGGSEVPAVRKEDGGSG